MTSTISTLSLVAALSAAALLATPVASQAADLTVVGSADLTGDPTGAMAVNGATDHVYLAGGFAESNVTVVDFTSLSSPTKTVVTSGPPVGVTANAAINTFYAYTGGFSGGRVSEFDGATNTLLQSSSNTATGCPGALDIDNTRGDVYMTSQCSDSIHRYDPGSNTILATTALAAVGGSPVVNEATGQVYVNTSVGVRVYSANLVLITTLSSLTIQNVNEVTNRLYLTTVPSADLVILDGTTHAELDRITGVTGAVAVDTGSNEFFVSQSGNALVLAYDGATNTLIDTISLGGAGVTTGVIVSDDAGRVYVRSFDAGASTLSALAVPEPSGLLLQLTALAALALLARGRLYLPSGHGWRARQVRC